MDGLFHYVPKNISTQRRALPDDGAVLVSPMGQSCAVVAHTMWNYVGECGDGH